MASDEEMLADMVDTPQLPEVSSIKSPKRPRDSNLRLYLLQEGKIPKEHSCPRKNSFIHTTIIKADGVSTEYPAPFVADFGALEEREKTQKVS